MHANCVYSIRVHVCTCVQCAHRQTHGSLRSSEYYREVDHRQTRPIANRQAPLINFLWRLSHLTPCHSSFITLSFLLFSPLCMCLSALSWSLICMLYSFKSWQKKVSLTKYSKATTIMVLDEVDKIRSVYFCGFSGMSKNKTFTHEGSHLKLYGSILNILLNSINTLASLQQKYLY